MTYTPRIAILASGSGSTAEALIEATQTEKLHADVALVICNNSLQALKKRNGQDAPTIYDRVNRLNRMYGLRIPVRHVSPITLGLDPLPVEQQTRGMREEEAAYCARVMQKNGSTLYVAAGWMKVITGALLDVPGLNSHPGILPFSADTIGRQASEMVLREGLSKNQHTVHKVAAEVDAGNVIARHDVPVLPGDTADTLFARTQDTEKRYLPVDVDQVLSWQREFGGTIPALMS